MPGDPKTTWHKRKPPGRERKLNGDCQGPGERELSKVPSTAVRCLSSTTEQMKENIGWAAGNFSRDTEKCLRVYLHIWKEDERTDLPRRDSRTY